ncbi:MAG TPA: zinc dependent phospholipase C family protein, partial [Acidimicrobiales bacterium]|nr:zinc dependent phospholipase C family protein [Acidimicrobiales bacterium]
MQTNRKMQRVIAATVLVVASVTMGVGDAGAAGITTHRWMAETALDQVTNGSLKALLEANMPMVQTGAGFPDVGYVAGNTYGETAHWQRFIDHLIDAIRARTDCGDLTDPNGPCAGLIAFSFGVAAHGIGDEVWDWLFEPNGPDHDEYWTGVPTATDDGAETQMDLVAIGLYGVARPEPGTVPDQPLVLQAFVDSGQTGVTADQFSLVESLPLLWDVEKGWADDNLAAVQAAMPWMSANLVTAPGGVDFAATAIAGAWDSLWGRLNGNQPPTKVSITYPASGETGVPATGWDRASFQPGSSHGRGGARNRIAAVLTAARPYTGASGGITVADELTLDSMTITDVATGDAIPLKSGYPRSVPYGSSSGERMIDTQPADNLATCTWYRVDVSVTAPVLDSRGEAVVPYTWQFQTECDGTET